jgi:hypothetical protein
VLTADRGRVQRGPAPALQTLTKRAGVAAAAGRPVDGRPVAGRWPAGGRPVAGRRLAGADRPDPPATAK